MLGWMKCKFLMFLVCILLVPLFCTRLYYSFVPRGAAFEPFVGYSRELAPISSPTGKTYRVFVNDAGAMHSGNHWVWVVYDDWFTGKSVILDGYITPEYASCEAELLVQWQGNVPGIQFAAGRY